MADSSRLGILKQLSEQVPVANQQLANGQQAAQTARMQEAVKQAAPTSNITAAAQQTGAQVAQGAGQSQVQAAQQTQNQLQAVGQSTLASQARGIRQVAGENAIQESQQSRQFSNQLAQLDNKAKKQIVDESLKFKLDEGGRALLNTRQLTDWAAGNAKSDEDYANKMQEIQHVSERKIQMMEMAQKKLQAMAEQGYYGNKQTLDQASRKKIMENAQAIEEKIRKEKAKAANNMMKAQSIGTVVGMVAVGAAVVATGGALAPAIPAIMAGGAVGGGLGSTYQANQG